MQARFASIGRRSKSVPYEEICDGLFSLIRLQKMSILGHFLNPPSPTGEGMTSPGSALPNHPPQRGGLSGWFCGRLPPLWERPVPTNEAWREKQPGHPGTGVPTKRLVGAGGCRHPPLRRGLPRQCEHWLAMTEGMGKVSVNTDTRGRMPLQKMVSAGGCRHPPLRRGLPHQ